MKIHSRYQISHFFFQTTAPYSEFCQKRKISKHKFYFLNLFSLLFFLFCWPKSSNGLPRISTKMFFLVLSLSILKHPMIIWACASMQYKTATRFVFFKEIIIKNERARAPMHSHSSSWSGLVILSPEIPAARNTQNIDIFLFIISGQRFYIYFRVSNLGNQIQPRTKFLWMTEDRT